MHLPRGVPIGGDLFVSGQVWDYQHVCNLAATGRRPSPVVAADYLLLKGLDRGTMTASAALMISRVRGLSHPVAAVPSFSRKVQERLKAALLQAHLRLHVHAICQDLGAHVV